MSSNTAADPGEEASTNLVRTSFQYTLDDNHRLQPGDKLSFQVLEDKHPPVTLIVTDSSELDVPYLGRVPVAGKTCRQLAAELKIQLERDYYYHATVIVGVDSVNQLRGQAFVSGDVHNQGAVDILFNKNLTVGEAIIRMGGFTEYADQRKVRVVRNDSAGDAGKKVFVVNVEDVMEQGKMGNDLVLEPGDYVIVPDRVIKF